MMEKPILFNTEMVRAILDGRKTQTRRLIRPQPEGQLSYIMGGSGTLPGKWDYMSASSAKAWDVEESRICEQDDGRLWTPPCHADDLLYVRETWSELYYVDPDGYTHYDRKMYFYAADGEPDIELLDADGVLEEDQRIRWKPSIHMPKAAARIWLKVKRVRVERLKDITEEDAKAEGISRLFDYLSDERFQEEIVRFVPDAKKEEFGWKNYLHGDLRDTHGYSDYQSPVDSFGSLWDSTVRDMKSDGWCANPWVWVIDFEQMEGRP